MTTLKTIITILAALCLSGCPDYTQEIDAAKRAFPGADEYTPLRSGYGYHHLRGMPIEVRTGNHYFVAVCHKNACTRVESAAMESD